MELTTVICADDQPVRVTPTTIPTGNLQVHLGSDLGGVTVVLDPLTAGRLMTELKRELEERTARKLTRDGLQLVREAGL